MNGLDIDGDMPEDPAETGLGPTTVARSMISAGAERMLDPERPRRSPIRSGW